MYYKGIKLNDRLLNIKNVLSNVFFFWRNLFSLNIIPFENSVLKPVGKINSE